MLGGLDLGSLVLDFNPVTPLFTCMSVSACVIIFSGSSRFLARLLRFDLATLAKRSKRLNSAVEDEEGKGSPRLGIGERGEDNPARDKPELGRSMPHCRISWEPHGSLTGGGVNAVTPTITHIIIIKNATSNIVRGLRREFII